MLLQPRVPSVDFDILWDVQRTEPNLEFRHSPLRRKVSAYIVPLAPDRFQKTNLLRNSMTIFLKKTDFIP